MSDRPLRILFPDDCVPHQVGGRGYPRANEIIRQFVKHGHTVTLYPLVVVGEPLSEAYVDIPRSVEIIFRQGVPTLASALSQLAMHIDVIWSPSAAPQHALAFMEALAQVPGLRQQIVLLYDAEAIYAEREVLKRRLFGEQVDAAQHAAAVAAELGLARLADALISVSGPGAPQVRAGHGPPGLRRQRPDAGGRADSGRLQRSGSGPALRRLDSRGFAERRCAAVAAR